MLTAALIFAATYVVVALGHFPGLRLDRTGAGAAVLMAKGLAAAVAMLAFFFAGANISEVALTAGAALLLTRRVKPEKVFLEINWNLLTLFAGLFVVVGAAQAAGLSGRACEVLHAREIQGATALTSVAAVLSNAISNVPAVAC